MPSNRNLEIGNRKFDTGVTRREALRLAAALGVALAGCATLPPRPPALAKKLIAFSGNEPDPAFLRRHLWRMEEHPFDGVVFQVGAVAPGGRRDSFTWEAFSARAFAEAEVAAALEDLRALPLQRFTHNFLRLNVTPGDVDWFDDFAPIRSNARLAARLARAGRAAGILLDTEPYAAPLFDYRRQRHAGARRWEAYAGQARRRGREVMEALQAGYPGLTLLLTFGHSAPWLEMQRGRRPLAECPLGLLAPWLDGMVEAARGGTRLVDGHEPAYFHDRDPARLAAAYRTMTQDLLPMVADPAGYRRVVSAGLGLMLDYDPRGRAWDGADGSQNYYTPEAFEASLRAALEVTDEYVWVYTDIPRWWSADGRPVHLPPGYTEAVRRARRGLARE